MTETSAFPELTADEIGALSRFRQGDVLADVPDVVISDEEGAPRHLIAPLGVVIVSQTCDVVAPNRPTIQVALRVQLQSTHAAEARDGKRPRYAHLPALGDDNFADLEFMATVDKRRVIALTRTPGVVEDLDGRFFSLAVARRYSRFPFPDEVTPWLRPLELVVVSRVRRANSPEALALESVVQLRVEAADGWREAPFELKLVVIVTPGTLPMFPGDDLPALPDNLKAHLYDDDRRVKAERGDIAKMLAKATDPIAKYWLWTALADAWAALCLPPDAAPPQVKAAVSSLLAEVVSADEFPLTRIRKSEELDLDHLSEPTPE